MRKWFINIMVILVVGLQPVFAQSRQDSLSYYLEIAAKENPKVTGTFIDYQAAVSQIDQMGNYPNPTLSIGTFIKPMHTMMGKQVSTFKLMQMFPWFGTRKSARSEATEQAKMSYQQFRIALDQLMYDVKSRWYNLIYLEREKINIQENQSLLKQIEILARAQYVSSTGSKKSGGKMMTTKGAGATSMSDLLRIQVEQTELVAKLDINRAKMDEGTYDFNMLLGRETKQPLSVASRLTMNDDPFIDSVALARIEKINPQLQRIRSQEEMYHEKEKKSRKLGSPSFAIGLQYMLMQKSSAPMVMEHMNGKDMVMPMIEFSLPLYRKRYKAAINQSKQQVAAAQERLQDEHNRLIAAYYSLDQRMIQQQAIVKLKSEQIKLTRSALQLMVADYTVGKQTLGEILEVQRALLKLHLEKERAIVDYSIAHAKVEQLLSSSISETIFNEYSFNKNILK